MTDFSDPLYSIRQTQDLESTMYKWLNKIERQNSIKVDSHTEEEMMVANSLWVLTSSLIAIRAIRAFAAADYTSNTFKGAWAFKLGTQMN